MSVDVGSQDSGLGTPDRYLEQLAGMLVDSCQFNPLIITKHGLLRRLNPVRWCCAFIMCTSTICASTMCASTMCASTMCASTMCASTMSASTMSASTMSASTIMYSKVCLNTTTAAQKSCQKTQSDVHSVAKPCGRTVWQNSVAEQCDRTLWQNKAHKRCAKLCDNWWSWCVYMSAIQQRIVH